MINNNIIATFNSEKEFKNAYPKTFYYSLKDDIFKVYWNNFCEYANSNNITIRPVVFKEINKMLKCKTSELGYSIYNCPNCHKTLCVHNTCKSRFCNSCGVKYSKQRTNDIISRLIDVPHRHLTFTMPDILWNLFLKDRTLLDIPFKAASQTLLSWFKDSYKKDNFKPGFILVLHTFGRDDKWNVHIHCLIAEYALGNYKDKKIDFFPYDMLRKRWQTILIKLLDKRVPPNIFHCLKKSCYEEYDKGFYVRAKRNEFPNSRKGLEYILRYCGRPCFAEYRIIDIKDGYVTFWYQRHEDDNFIVEKIHIFEFIGRLIRHIPEPNFKTIRSYGFYSSKRHSLYNIARKIIHKDKIPFYKSITKWRNLIFYSFKRDPLKCECGTIMILDSIIPRLEC